MEKSLALVPVQPPVYVPPQWLPADAPPRLTPSRRPDLDIFGRTAGQLEAEAPPAPPPLRAHSVPAPGVGELHGLLVAELSAAAHLPTEVGLQTAMWSASAHLPLQVGLLAAPSFRGG